jgi:hypothetical protein
MGRLSWVCKSVQSWIMPWSSYGGMASWKPDLSADGDELAQRVARLRQQSEALEKARSAAEQGRDLIDQMKQDADDVYKALTFDKPSNIPSSDET